MTRWLARQLAPISTGGAQVAVVLDPDAALDADAVSHLGKVVRATDWYELRRAYEQEGRYREPEQGLLVILVQTPRYRVPRDLPFDIEQQATVVQVRIPGPREFGELLLELPDTLSARAAEILEDARDPVKDLASGLWGVVLPALSADQEFVAAAKLRLDASVPPSLWSHLEGRFTHPLARALVEHPPDIERVQDAWEDWLSRGNESQWAELFQRVGTSVAPLFHSGLLSPAPGRADDLPSWLVSFGVADVSAEERLEALLEARPEPWPSFDASGWIGVAGWWGEVRSVAAMRSDDLRRRAWAMWDELDAAFVPWLTENYNGLLLRSGALPLTVNKIAGFLAKRLRSGEAERVLLVVLDGMGFMQWSSLQRALGIRVAQAEGSYAMVPTLTPVSRQAILAGTSPTDFPETIRDTSAEERRWLAFWAGQDVDVRGVRYTRTGGTSPQDVPEFGHEVVRGLVVSAIDEQLHGVKVLGDPEVSAFVGAWAERGFLASLLEQAGSEGFEIWFTADHGNLEVLPLGARREGLNVDAAGLRVRWYTSEAQRASSDIDGIAWDPACLPPDVCFPLFPKGRGGYFSGDVRVTHGGISLDEVIVPLVQVAR